MMRRGSFTGRPAALRHVCRPSNRTLQRGIILFALLVTLAFSFFYYLHAPMPTSTTTTSSVSRRDPSPPPSSRSASPSSAAVTAPTAVSAAQPATPAPAASSQPERMLAFCGEYGRFSNEVVAFLKVVWLATNLNRTLVLPRLIFGEPVSSLFDIAWLQAHFDRNGGAFIERKHARCAVTADAFVPSMSANMVAALQQANDAPLECVNELSACSFAGVQRLRTFDVPGVPVVTASPSPSQHLKKGRLRWRNTSVELLPLVGSSTPSEVASLPMLAMFQRGAFYMSVPADELPILPYHPDLVKSALRVLAALPRIGAVAHSDDTGRAAKQVITAGEEGGGVSLCVHLRREDLRRKQPSLEAVAADINSVVDSRGVTQLFVAHNANEHYEVPFLRARLPTGTQFGCDRERWPACNISAAHQIVVEQALCSHADLFLGSPFSSFTAMIAAQRERLTAKDPSTMRLLQDASSTARPRDKVGADRSRPTHHFLTLSLHLDRYV